MRKNFKTLNTPWNPGFALSQSIVNEGWQNAGTGGYQLARGTGALYAPGKGGYDIPRGNGALYYGTGGCSSCGESAFDYSFLTSPRGRMMLAGLAGAAALAAYFLFLRKK